MDGLVTWADMNILPLKSYDVLIGMDWLEAHREKLDCYKNTFECMVEIYLIETTFKIPLITLGCPSSSMH